MILIVGGGLSGCLLAYRLAQLKSPPAFLLIESKANLCGNHTWSFHHSDLTEDTFRWMDPLISRTWSQQEVRFLDHGRRFNQPYHSIKSEELAQKIKKVLGDRVRLGTGVRSLSADEVILETGERLAARVVFDARGTFNIPKEACGYQKFLGMDLELVEPHSIQNPIIMDATCEQRDGFRFFYLLPWSNTQLLIEDTRYSNEPDIDLTEYREEILQLCKNHQWKIKKISRTESAALPIPLQSRAFHSPFNGPIEIGLKGGYFHLTTGYSLTYAAELAELVANHLGTQPHWDGLSLKRELQPFNLQINSQSRFFALLNRMLFRAANPADRWIIFSRFYRLQEELIFRFYRGNLKRLDQLRILVGKPPVSVLRAIQQLNP